MIASSSFSNAVVTKQGSLFTWGSSGLGHGRWVTDSAPVYIDKATFETSPIIMAACGFSGSIALTEAGGVWTCGKKQHAGTYADDNLYHCIPTQYFHDKTIVMVTSGDYHMLSIDTEGMLWVWGDNCYGQLCCGALEKCDLIDTCCVIVTGSINECQQKVIIGWETLNPHLNQQVSSIS